MKPMRSSQVFILLAALLTAVLPLSACTGGARQGDANGEARRVNATLIADLATLQRENQQLAQRQGAAEAEIQRLQGELDRAREEQARFRDMMSTNFDLLEQSVALTLTRQVEGPARPVAKPNANVAKAAYAPPHRQAEPAAPQTAARTAPPPPAKRTASAHTPPQGAPAVARAGSGVNPMDDPDLRGPSGPRRLVPNRAAKPLYEQGFGLFARKEYDQAVMVFSNFLNRYPDDIYSDNAQFWIGESHRMLNRGDKAEQAYRAVLRNYEHRSTLEGYKTPDALYRLGQLYQARSEPQHARIYFRAVAERYPETSAGRKAESALSSLGLSTALK